MKCSGYRHLQSHFVIPFRSCSPFRNGSVNGTLQTTLRLANKLIPTQLLVYGIILYNESVRDFTLVSFNYFSIVLLLSLRSGHPPENDNNTSLICISEITFAFLKIIQNLQVWALQAMQGTHTLSRL